MAKNVRIVKPGEAGGKVDDAVLERAAQETSRMGLAERIFHYDKMQGRTHWADGNGNVLPVTITPEELAAIPARQVVRHPEVIVCRHDRDHGALMIRGDGATLICGGRKDGAFCTFNQPVSV